MVSNIRLFVDLYNNPARGKEQGDAIFENNIKFRRAQ